jgi:hypothetical protein
MSSAAAVLRGETEEGRRQWLRRQVFVEQLLFDTTSDVTDSTLAFRFRAFTPSVGLNQEELAKLQPHRDAIDDEMRRDQLGAPPLFNLGEAIGQG